jgi:hypothetical protein
VSDEGAISMEKARSLLYRAIPAVVTGDLTTIELFTEDVIGDAEQLSVRSRTDLEHQMADRSGVLSRIDFRLDGVEEFIPGVIATWRLSGDHTGEVLLDEDVLLEPTGRRIDLSAMTRVVFRQHRICWFDNIFDGPGLVEQIRRPP